jgi:hypothetical protein
MIFGMRDLKSFMHSPRGAGFKDLPSFSTLGEFTESRLDLILALFFVLT